MRKLVVSEFLTLDGVMQAPGSLGEDTEGGFAHGGWAVPYLDEASNAAGMEGLDSSDALLIGRKTYDIFAAYWPTAPDEVPFAKGINSITKYVVSRSQNELEWRNSVLIRGDIVQEITKLKRQTGKNMVVLGSGELVQTLMQNDLIDEYGLMIFPLVLGSGKRLFRDDGVRQLLTLLDSKTTSTGVQILTYRRKL